MKKQLFLMLAIIVASFSACQKDIDTAPPIADISSTIEPIFMNGNFSKKYEPNQLLVKFKNGRPDQLFMRTQNAVAVDKVLTKTMERAGYSGFHILMVPNVEQAAAAFKRNPNVEWANPNYIYTHDAYTPTNDTYWSSLWGMPNIKADVAWNAGNTGDQQVYVGVIDEGIMYWHEDLCGQIWTNPYETENGIDDDGNGYIDDIHGWDFMHNDNTIYDMVDNHGTHVAGTIGGKGNNSKGVVGVSPNVTIISGKFLEGSGNSADAARAVDYMTDLKVRHGMNIATTSNSWGGGGYDQALYDAINRAKTQNILFVAAAGNSGANTDVNINYPSCFNLDNIIAVAAYNSSETLPSWTNYGLTTVDIGAPGVSIQSTLPGSQGASAYGSYSGTSMATPHVAGAVALYKAGNPTATYTEVKNAILNNARPIAALTGKCVTGGVLNVSSFTKATTNQQVARGCVVPNIDYVAPTAPTNFKEYVRDTIAKNSRFTWTAATDNVKVNKYVVTIDYSWYTAGYTVSGDSTGFTTGGFRNGVLYPMTIAAYDAWNNKSPVVSYTLSWGNDTVPPSTPKNFKVVAKDATSVTFSYDWATDDWSGIGMYRISYRPASCTSCTWSGWHTNNVNPLQVPGLTTNTQYAFTVAAMDNNHNWSAESSPAILETPGSSTIDLIAPSAPAGLNATATSTSITPYWIASTDNVGVVGYDVYYKLSSTSTYTLAGSTSNTLLQVNGLTSSTSYDFYVKAKDAAGNISAASNVFTKSTEVGADVTPPTAPTNLTATSTTNSITASWNTSIDNIGVAGYNVYYKLSSASTYTLYSTVAGTSVTIPGLTSGVSYNVYVTARDAAGNTSSSSNIATISTQTPPPYVISVSLTGVLQKKSQHKLSWTGSITPSGSNIKSAQLQWLSNSVWTTLYTSTFISDVYTYTVSSTVTRQYRVVITLNSGETATSNSVFVTSK